jgi:hypothetical protein
MSPGKKSIQGVVNKGIDQTATIKIQSPLQKSLLVTDTLKNAGAGIYIVAVADVADSIIGLSYHSFTVLNSDSFRVDSVVTSVFNTTKGTILISHDSLTLSMRADFPLDSAMCYFRDISALGFDSVKIKSSASSYSFKVKAPKDGSTLAYYFKAYKNNDIYGYSQKTFLANVPPDMTKLTKIEILPTSSDTLILPSEYSMTFTVKGYYGSQFTPSGLDSTAVTWRFADSSYGCKLESKGNTAVLTTPSAATPKPVKVRAVVDNAKVLVDLNRIPNSDGFVYVKGSGKKMAKIRVTRIDPQAGFAISTSSLSKAEFNAVGISTDSTVLSINSTWSIVPDVAGTISATGVFKPSKKFAGIVRVLSSSGSSSGEYSNTIGSQTQLGLEVQHLIMASPDPDTVTTGNGCTIVFPDSVVADGKPALLQILNPVVENQRARMTKNMTAVGTLFDIKELNGTPFQLHNADSIRLSLSVPQGINTGDALTLGYWNEDSLNWASVANASLAQDRNSISANIAHFSRWAILAISKELQSSLTVYPNPFCPRKSPSDNEFANKPLRAMFGSNAPKGTCISFVPDIPGQKITKISVKIYTIVNDLVCSVVMQNATKLVKYNLWWDGRATDRDMLWDNLASGADSYSRVFPPSNRKLCRSGRYFVVLVVEDESGKKKSFMNQIVLVN